MIPPLPTDPRRRAERKADLLLVSALLRGQAGAALDEIGGRADGLLRRALVVRGWLSDPLVLAAASGGVAFIAARRQRRSRLWRGMRWAWLAWRVWRGR